MSKNTDLTRRGALASIGASAVVAASPTLAASALSTTAKTEAVTVVWPAYHLAAGRDRPRTGEPVILRADNEPYMTPALGIYSEQGLKLGYVAPRKAEKLLAALDRGAKLDARIAAKQESAVSDAHESGWHLSTLSVTTELPRAFA